jgi:methionine synthase II (cobalamin-independent)
MALRTVENDAIRDAVALQESAGLQLITDGEFRRSHYLVDFMTALDGIVPTHTSYAMSFRGEGGETGETRSMLSVTGKIRRPKPIMLEGFLVLKSITQRTPKICIPSPTWVHMRGGRKTVNENVYPDIEEFWDDIVQAFHEEIGELAAAGCTYLQIDEISFAFLCDQTIRERIKADGLDPDRLIQDYARVVDRIAAGAPEAMTVAVHTCRGNFQSMWMAEAAMIALPRRRSISRMLMRISSNMTANAQVASNRCSTFRTARKSCSALSVQKNRKSRARILSNAGSKRRQNFSRFHNSASHPSAVSPARITATASRKILSVKNSN